MMAVAGAPALWLVVGAVRRARAAGDLDGSAALTFGVAWLVSIPSAAVAFSGSLKLAPDVFGNLVKIYPGWYDQLTHVGLILIVVLAGGLTLFRLSAHRVPLHTAAVLGAVLVVVAAIGAGLHGTSAFSFHPVVLLICLLAAAVLPRGRGACVGAGLYGVTLGIASAVVGLVHYDVAFVVPCNGSCSLLGFQGVLSNENLLGIALAASLPFAYLGFRGRARLWLSVYLVGLVVATGSVTATTAAGVTLVVLLIVRPRLDATGPTPRATLTGIVLAVAVLGSSALVVHQWPPTFLGDRGQLWTVATHYIGASPLVGYGPDRWATLYLSGEIPLAGERSAHNQWMDVLFAAGVIGVMLLVAMAAVMLRSAGRARPAVAITLATLAMIGTAEGTWQVGALDSMSFSLLAVILTGAAAPLRPPRRVAGDRLVRRRRPARAREPSPVVTLAAPGR